MAATRKSLNQAFWDLGLRFQWDEDTWVVLEKLPDLETQIKHYLTHYQPHLLAVYDVELLGRLVEKQLTTPGETRMGMEAHRST
jgi:hypothetical protein